MLTAALLVAGILPGSALASNEVAGTFAFYSGVTISKGGYEVRIETREFDPSAHEVNQQAGQAHTIDGQTRHGVGWGRLPTRELGSVSAKYKGKSLVLDKSLWAHVYNPWVDETAFAAHRGSSAKLVDGDLQLTIAGGDGAVAYWFILTLRPSGNHTREFLVH